MYYNENHPPCRCGCGELADECAGPAPRPLGSMTVTATFDRPATYFVVDSRGYNLDAFSRSFVQSTARDALGSATPTTGLWRSRHNGQNGLTLRITDATPAQLAAVEAAFAVSHIPFTLTAV